MYKDRTEQRRVTETMNSLLIPMLNYLNNDTAIIVRRALSLLGEIDIEPQEGEEPCKDWYDVPSDEMTLEQARQAIKDLRKKLVEHLEQEPQTGHWFVDERPESDREIICSNCEQPILKYHKLDFDYRPKYCPNCGCRMVETQESEDKCKNCEYYSNPDYTRCHECEAKRSEE